MERVRSELCVIAGKLTSDDQQSPPSILSFLVENTVGLSIPAGWSLLQVPPPLLPSSRHLPGRLLLQLLSDHDLGPRLKKHSPDPLWWPAEIIAGEPEEEMDNRRPVCVCERA